MSSLAESQIESKRLRERNDQLLLQVSDVCVCVCGCVCVCSVICDDCGKCDSVRGVVVECDGSNNASVWFGM